MQLVRVAAPVKALDISNTNSLLKPETSMGELEALVDGLRTDRPRLSTTETLQMTGRSKLSMCGECSETSQDAVTGITGQSTESAPTEDMSSPSEGNGSRTTSVTTNMSAMLPAQLLQSPMMGVVKSRALAGEH
ncbi:hypothetical protein QBZ16_000070 [Prototheca wickerhamii]|uniref:Uncharacterized protein n=1 Tax=Prototheca wickerhamii TaxID=3111 RepID=A0AAD9IPI6_PROWI|nr:hypothetical protein QBZ16_000070 [Prototheca wickerhamii]